MIKNKDEQLQDIMDALRIVFYGEPGNLLLEIENLGELLAQYDGVAYTDDNRLIILMEKLAEVNSIL